MSESQAEERMEEYRPLFIGGEWVEPASGETMDDVNPATGEVIAKIAVGSREDIDLAVAAAQKAYDEVWFDTPAKERSAMLLKLADAVDEHGDEFARLESIDVGKPISAAAADIPYVSDNLRFFAAAARCPEGKSSRSTRGASPASSAASLWASPPASARGTTHSWCSPGSSAQPWPRATPPSSSRHRLRRSPRCTSPSSLPTYCPPGCSTCVTGPGAEIGDAICRHPDVRLVAATGDMTTGKLVAAACAETLKHVHLELGGKAPRSRLR